MAKKRIDDTILNIADVPLDAGRIHKRDQYIAGIRGSNYRKDAYADVQDIMQNPAPVDLGATAYGNIMRDKIQEYFAAKPSGMTDDYLSRLIDFDKVTYSKTAGVSKAYYSNRYWPRIDGSYMETPIIRISFKVISVDQRFELRFSWQRVLSDYGEFQTPTRNFTLNILLVDTVLQSTVNIGADRTHMLIDSDHNSLAAHTKLFNDLFLEVMYKSNNASTNQLETFFKRQRKDAALYDVYR